MSNGRDDLEILIAETYIRDIIASLLLGKPWHSYKVRDILVHPGYYCQAAPRQALAEL